MSGRRRSVGGVASGPVPTPARAARPGDDPAPAGRPGIWRRLRGPARFRLAFRASAGPAAARGPTVPQTSLTPHRSLPPSCAPRARQARSTAPDRGSRWLIPPPISAVRRPGQRPGCGASAPAGKHRRRNVVILLLCYGAARRRGSRWSRLWNRKHQGGHDHPTAAIGAEEAEQQADSTGAVVKGKVGPGGATARLGSGENAKPGTSSDLSMKGPTTRSRDSRHRVSITPGQSVNLYVSSTAPVFQVEATDAFTRASAAA